MSKMISPYFYYCNCKVVSQAFVNNECDVLAGMGVNQKSWRKSWLCNVGKCLLNTRFFFFNLTYSYTNVTNNARIRICYSETVFMALVIEMVMALSKDFIHPAKLVRPLKIIFIVSLKRRKPRRVFHKLIQFT